MATDDPQPPDLQDEISDDRLHLRAWRHQAELILTDRPRSLLVAGRKAGKTTAAAMRLADRAWRFPGKYRWIAPTSIQLRVGIETLQSVFVGRPEVQYKIGDATFMLPNSSRIECLSAEGRKSLRGAAVAGLVIDEAAWITGDTWIKDLEPDLTATRGWAVLASTPNGMNWLWELHERTKNHIDWLHLEYPTWKNPNFTEEEIRAKRPLMGDSAWAQEHLGMFVASERALWPVEYFDGLLVGEIPPAYQRCALAVDLSEGNMKSDYQGLVVMGFVGGRHYLHCEALRMSAPNLLTRIKQLSDLYRPEMIVVDATGGHIFTADAIRDQWPNGLGMPRLLMLKETENKETRIQRLAGPLHQRLVRILDNDGGREYIREARDFPNGKYDDVLDAHEMAFRALTRTLAA